ncbi:MAG: SMC-Scp complex subunit ScpB [Armatimonadetes bacterium]|nr:SMC-Scp complex subunit ScpB [Armatimonadota bacterium]
MTENFSPKLILEAILFASSKSLSLKELEDITKLDAVLILSSLEELKNDLKERGIQLIEIAQGYQLVANSIFAPYIEKLYKNIHYQNFSKAALETLAIIAYKQPITRAQIEDLRGVNVDKIINNLLEKKLIKEAGKAQIIGKPTLYGTTSEFLRYFALNSLNDLPAMGQLEGDNQIA